MLKEDKRMLKCQECGHCIEGVNIPYTDGFIYGYKQCINDVMKKLEELVTNVK